MAQQYAYDLNAWRYEALVAHGGRERSTCWNARRWTASFSTWKCGDGRFEVLRACSGGFRIPVLVYTAGQLRTLHEAIRLGARSFIDKAERWKRVVQEVEHASSSGLAGELAACGIASMPGTLVGASPPCSSSRTRSGAWRRSEPVLWWARAARERSSSPGAAPSGRESGRAFIALNARPPENLVEESCSARTGRITGAGALRKGAFEAASVARCFSTRSELPRRTGETAARHRARQIPAGR